MNVIVRFIAALAGVLVLGVDDCEEGTVNKPSNIDPVEWAQYNASQARTLKALSAPRAPNLDGACCECGTCETCQRRHAEARAVVNEALAKALREVSR